MVVLMKQSDDHMTTVAALDIILIY